MGHYNNATICLNGHVVRVCLKTITDYTICTK